MKPLFARKNLIWAAPVAAAFLSGCLDSDDGDAFLSGPADIVSSRAVAEMRGYPGYPDSALRGAIGFREENDSLVIEADIAGLEPGKSYGIHVHQFGDCAYPGAAGGHFDSEETHGDPYDSLGSHHRGDLPNFEADGDGIGRFRFATRDMSLDSGGASALGRSVVLQREPDDFVTQPSGGPETGIACGVITLIEVEADGGEDSTGTDSDATDAVPDSAGADPGDAGTGVDSTGTGADPISNPVPTRPF